ncbi:MAG: response regulator [Candidatus Wallbacteria bacterium]|nr:response regulator [Candidatus Wallbacteria bacterium]
MNVLVVEDNEDNLALATKVLRFGGHEVTAARSGEEALAVVAVRRPDVVLMDLGLPEMDGWEATRRMRSMEGMGSVPVIALTAHALRPQDRERALEAGCCDYVTKPFDRKQLLDLIEQHAAVSGTAKGPAAAGAA